MIAQRPPASEQSVTIEQSIAALEAENALLRDNAKLRELLATARRFMAHIAITV